MVPTLRARSRGAHRTSSLSNLVKLPPIRTITTKRAARALLQEMYPRGVLGGISPEFEFTGLDTEFFEEDDSKFHLASMQIATRTARYFIQGPVYAASRGKDPKRDDCIRVFFPYLKDPKALKAYSTPRAEFKSCMMTYGFDIAGLWHDTEVGDWLLDENRRFHGLKDAASDFLGLYMEDYAKVFRFFVPKKDGTPSKKHKAANILQICYGKERYRLDGIPWSGSRGRKMLREYAAKDPYATLQLARFQRALLKKEGLLEWYQQVELPCARMIINVERRGIGIDVNKLDEIRGKVYAELMRLEHVVRAAAEDWQLNLRSNPQLQALLFDKLKWPVIERNDLTEAQEAEGQEEGNPSLSRDTLIVYSKKHKFRLADHLLSHRMYSTMHSNFLVGALEKRSVDDVIRTILKQARTVTGRFASGDRLAGKMNLQNVPSKKDRDPYKLRRFFNAPTRDDGEEDELVIGDYAQVELYIIAQLSGDARMIQAFSRGEDLHMLTCSKIFKIKLPRDPSSWVKSSASYQDWLKACEEWKEKWKDQRTSAKGVNFGLNYGMSAFKLANDHNMSEQEAERWIQDYFDLYPGVDRFMRQTIRFLHKHGYVLTIAGRKRRLPEVHSSDKWEVRRAERQGINAPIQGSAADIIKVVMDALEFGPSYLDVINPKWFDVKRSRPALVELAKPENRFALRLQVHDELLTSVAKGEGARLAPVVRTVMESAFPAFFKDVALTASVGSGPSWAEAKV